MPHALTRCPSLSDPLPPMPRQHQQPKVVMPMPSAAHTNPPKLSSAPGRLPEPRASRLCSQRQRTSLRPTLGEMSTVIDSHGPSPRELTVEISHLLAQVHKGSGPLLLHDNTHLTFMSSLSLTRGIRTVRSISIDCGIAISCSVQPSASSMVPMSSLELVCDGFHAKNRLYSEHFRFLPPLHIRVY